MSSVVKSYRAALDSVWADLKQLSVLDVERNEKQRRIGLTIVWFVASLLLALFVPDIGKVISLLGSLAAIFIFVFPGRFDCHRAWISSRPCWSFKQGLAKTRVKLVLSSPLGKTWFKPGFTGKTRFKPGETPIVCLHHGQGCRPLENGCRR